MKLTKKHARAVLGNAAEVRVNRFEGHEITIANGVGWATSEHGSLTVTPLPPEAAQLPDDWRHVLRATLAQASRDGTRPHVAHVLLDGQHAVATDGHRLCSLPCDVALPGELLLTAAIGWAEVEGRGPAFIGMRDGRPFLWVAPWPGAAEDFVADRLGWLVEAALPVDGRKLDETETALGPKDFPRWSRVVSTARGCARRRAMIDGPMVGLWLRVLDDVRAHGHWEPGVQITEETRAAVKLTELAPPSGPPWTMRTCSLPLTQSACREWPEDGDEPLDVGVNAPYLAAAIRAVDDGSGIQLWVGGAVDPIVVAPKSAGDAWRTGDTATPVCIVMPVRI